jgi:hypothetical protein
LDAEADGDACVVLVAWRAEHVVASAGYDRLREPGVAEVAFTPLLAVPELVEADLNPVRCLTDGALVLDMRLRLERRPRAESVTRW